MRDTIRIIISLSFLISGSVNALSYTSLDSCLASAVDCKNETRQLLKNTAAGSRDWYILMYYNLSARWDLDNLSLTRQELSGYADMTDAPDVFKIVVYTIYAKKLLSSGETEQGTEYAHLARDLIMRSAEYAPDPRRLAELIILHNYLKDYNAASELADWAVRRTENIRNPDAKAPLHMAIAHVAFFIKDYDKALQYYGYVAEAHEHKNEPLQLSNAYSSLGVVYLHKEEYKQARYYLKQAGHALDQALGTYETGDKTYIRLRLLELDFIEGKKEAAIAALAKIDPGNVHKHHMPLYRKLQTQAGQSPPPMEMR